MRIILTADPELPVPPRYYGGIERVVDILVRGLIERGHEVTLFAHAASVTGGRLVGWPGQRSNAKMATLRNMSQLAIGVLRHKPDIVHSFSRVAYLAPILVASVPKLMTYQRPIHRRSVELGHAFSRGSLWFSAISRQMTAGVSNIGTWRIVHNGVPLGRYTFEADPGGHAPLVFLGRIEPIKGAHLAIEIAKRANCRLVIAGNIPAEHQAYFRSTIEPHIDGSQVTYIGPVDDPAKDRLLGSARALLMPIQWEEPFGIVMAEAMACGTPVLGLARGAVPEVVEDGVTGFVLSNVADLAAAVGRLHTIDRRACRARAEKLFSECALVDAYEKIYCEMLIGRTKARYLRVH